MDSKDENKNHEDLIHDYLKGNISKQAKESLFRWLKSNPSNLSYFNHISDIWLSSSVFQETQNFDSILALERVKSQIGVTNGSYKQRGSRLIQLSWHWAAAILILVFILSRLTFTWFSPGKTNLTGEPLVFNVPYGSMSSVMLSDGSKVELNAGSTLILNEGFGSTHRVLKLEGEGYFSAAKNNNIPFIVQAGNLNIKALGTEFNVKAYTEDKTIETVLIEGTLQINKLTGSSDEENNLILKPNQSLVYKKNSGTMLLNINADKNKNDITMHVPEPLKRDVVIVKSSVNPAVYTSWKETLWVIDKESLSDLAVELGRKYDVTIKFGNEELKDIKFSGTLKDESIEQVLAAISLAYPIMYKINGKSIELIENKAMIKKNEQYYSSPDTN